MNDFNLREYLSNNPLLKEIAMRIEDDLRTMLFPEDGKVHLSRTHSMRINKILRNKYPEALAWLKDNDRTGGVDIDIHNALQNKYNGEVSYEQYAKDFIDAVELYADLNLSPEEFDDQDKQDELANRLLKENKMDKFNLREYISNNPLLKEGLKQEENPFRGEFEGTFLSNDGGITGIFITIDSNFDSGDFETLGDEAIIDLNGMPVKIVAVYA
tara:strand:- start:1244 stop:1885 length:642 start_codon:yes stop_codon:yes gene_type:complete